jgi:hypothetical protein
MELLKPISVNSTVDNKTVDKINSMNSDPIDTFDSTKSTAEVKVSESAQVTLSTPSPQRLLEEQLLLDSSRDFIVTEEDEFRPFERREPFYIQQQYVNNVSGNIDLVNSNKDTQELSNAVQRSLDHSQSVHQNITDIFSSLGQLDKDTESYLVASQSYIESNLKNNFPTLDTENEFMQGSSLFGSSAFNAGAASGSNTRFNNVSYTVETLEGDTVTVTYQALTPSMRLLGEIGDEGFSGLSYQVDGELSEEEHEALNKLFLGTAEYVGQVFGENQTESGLDSINIAESFDMSLLKGFSINTNYSKNETRLEYDTNQETQEQTLSMEMTFTSFGLSKDIDFNLTTSLLGDKDEEELTRYGIEMRDLLNEFGFQSKGGEMVNEFIVDSFTSLFDVETQESKHLLDGLVIPTIGRRVGANQFTSQISSLMDYSFSLNADENKGGAREVNTKIKLAQLTESVQLENLYEFSQRKSFSLYSTLPSNSKMDDIKGSDVVVKREEELENKLVVDSNHNTLNFASEHTLFNRIEDTKSNSDGSVITYVTQESIVELSELKLVDDILSNMYISTIETKKETIEKEEQDGAARVTAKSKALDVYMQYDALKLS